MLCLLLPQPETKIYNQDLSVKRMSVYVLAPSEGQLGCGSPISSGWMYGSKSVMGPLSLLCVCVCVWTETTTSPAQQFRKHLLVSTAALSTTISGNCVGQCGQNYVVFCLCTLWQRNPNPDPGSWGSVSPITTPLWSTLSSVSLSFQTCLLAG